MDHSWGLNVELYGLGDLGLTLAARDLDFGPIKLLVTNARDGTDYLSVHVPANSLSNVPYILNWQPALGRNFPFLRNVPPDEPV